MNGNSLNQRVRVSLCVWIKTILGRWKVIVPDLRSKSSTQVLQSSCSVCMVQMHAYQKRITPALRDIRLLIELYRLFSQLSGCDSSRIDYRLLPVCCFPAFAKMVASLFVIVIVFSNMVLPFGCYFM